MTLDEIIAGCKRHENKYQTILFEKYYSRMLIICARYCENGDEAKDLLQEGFITIFDKVNTFKAEVSGGFPAWMGRIMRNKCIDEIRKKKKVIKVGLEMCFEEPIFETETLVDIFDEKLTIAIEKLTPKYKQTLKLYYFEDKSYKEISEILGIQLSTCKSNLKRSKENVKNILLNL